MTALSKIVYDKRTSLECGMTSWAVHVINILVVQVDKFERPVLTRLSSVDEMSHWAAEVGATNLAVASLYIALTEKYDPIHVYAVPSSWTCAQWCDAWHADFDPALRGLRFHCPFHHSPGEQWLQVKLAESCDMIVMLDPDVHEAVNALVANPTPPLDPPAEITLRYNVL
jgi:hypothetical protein